MQATQLRSNLRSCQVTIPEKVEVPSLGGGINGVDVSRTLGKSLSVISDHRTAFRQL
jgi:hypothetical protein